MPTSTESIKERWGEQIRLARLRRHQSQALVGDFTGLTGPTVSRAEQGQGSVDVYDRLARHYGITLDLGEPA